MLLPQSYLHPDISEGADSITGQLRRVKECPISASGISIPANWSKVPESDARRVHLTYMYTVIPLALVFFFKL